jgi:hypothetical protein
MASDPSTSDSSPGLRSPNLVVYPLKGLGGTIVTSIIIYAAMAFAQSPVAPATPVPPAIVETAPAQVSAPTLRLPALTPVRLCVIGEISSKTHVKGDKVEIILAEPLRLNDTLAIPAGTRGVAEVIHSAKGGMGGKAGELLVAARSLDLSPDLHIPLRSFRLAPASGKNNEGLAMGLSIAGGVAGGIAAMVMTGGSARIADRSEAFAKTAADVDLPIAQLEAIPASPFVDN